MNVASVLPASLKVTFARMRKHVLSEMCEGDSIYAGSRHELKCPAAQKGFLSYTWSVLTYFGGFSSAL